MQPSATPKPVMDVTAPKQTAPPVSTAAPTEAAAAPAPSSPTLTVHQAPASTDSDRQSQESQKPVEAVETKKAPHPKSTPKSQASGPQQPAADPLPVGAIVMAVLAMAILASITIAIYINTR